MPPSIASLSKSSHSKHSPEVDVEEKSIDVEKSPVSAGERYAAGDDSDFGGPDARKALERRLLWKLDLRMSILVVIYVLNYVRTTKGASVGSLD